jgi:RNA polymerase sigma-70 factor, ECF subfamily
MTADPAAIEAEARRLCDAGDAGAAATVVIAGLGPELMGFLAVMTRDLDEANEVFAELCVRIWRGLPGFRWESSLRTWAYVVARHALHDHAEQRAAWRGRHAAMPEDSELHALITRVRLETTTRLRNERQGRAARLRARLSPDEQALLTLRVDRGLPWADVARVLGVEGDGAVATLRKRYQRLMEDLKKMAAEEPED